MNLYDKHAKSFSDTRQYPWEGWKKLQQYFKENQPLKLLDLGCGNGRLIKTIKNEELRIKNYVGVDNSQILINVARKEMSKFEIRNSNLLKIDLEDESWSKSLKDESFNIICSFGLIHHIHTKALREKLFAQACALAESGAYIIFSFWQFAMFPEFLEKHVLDPKSVDYDGVLNQDDYILSFGGKKSGAFRFCHSFSDAEIIELSKNVQNIKLIETFSSDGLENRMNKYAIWQKA